MTLQPSEIKIAFALWELSAQLEALLWDRYFDEFNEILYESEKEYPFTPRNHL